MASAQSKLFIGNKKLKNCFWKMVSPGQFAFKALEFSFAKRVLSNAKIESTFTEVRFSMLFSDF